MILRRKPIRGRTSKHQNYAFSTDLNLKARTCHASKPLIIELLRDQAFRGESSQFRMWETQDSFPSTERMKIKERQLPNPATVFSDASQSFPQMHKSSFSASQGATKLKVKYKYSDGVICYPATKTAGRKAVNNCRLG